MLNFRPKRVWFEIQETECILLWTLMIDPDLLPAQKEKNLVKFHPSPPLSRFCCWSGWSANPAYQISELCYHSKENSTGDQCTHTGQPCSSHQCTLYNQWMRIWWMERCQWSTNIKLKAKIRVTILYVNFNEFDVKITPGQLFAHGSMVIFFL